MKTRWTKVMGALVLALAVATLGFGCSKSKEETAKEKLTKDNVANLDKEMKALEAHQATLGKMIKQMQAQLGEMQAELDSQAPKMKSANDSIAYLQTLITEGFGASAGSYMWTHPAWNLPAILAVVSFLIILWIFYRIRHRQNNPTS